MLNDQSTASLKIDLVAKLLIGTVALLSAASLTALGLRFYGGYEYAYGFVPLFEVDGEGNIPTYFSSMLHLTSSVLLTMITIAARQRQNPGWKKWAGLAVKFVAASIDEASSIHELLTYPMREILGTHGVLYFAWLVPAILLLIVAALFYWPFFRKLPKTTFVGFMIAATVFLSGAVVMEFLGGWFAENKGVAALEFCLATEVEEFLEMTGAVIFIRTLLLYISQHVGRFRISFDS